MDARRRALAARMDDRRTQLSRLRRAAKASRASASSRPTGSRSSTRSPRREGIDRGRIALFGRSLGTGVAAHVAASRPVAGVVLVSPYDSLTAIGSHHYPWLPVSLLLRHRFEALADAARCRMPLLAIVGEDDTIIPVARSRALYDAWAGPKDWYAIRDGDHNTLGASSGFGSASNRFLETTKIDLQLLPPPGRLGSVAPVPRPRPHEPANWGHIISDGQPIGDENMKRATTMLTAFAVVLALALPSWAQVKELPKQTVTVAGTVETIDKSRRAVNIKTADGKFVAVDVPASAKRFDELKVGDKVKATYNNNVMVRLKPAGEAAVDTADASSTMGKGAQPGGTASMVRSLRCAVATPSPSSSACAYGSARPAGFGGANSASPSAARAFAICRREERVVRRRRCSPISSINA